MLRSLENSAKADIDDTNNNRKDKKQDLLVFSTKFFAEVKELKKLVRDMEDDIKILIGNSRVIFGLKKNQSIKQKTVKNRLLSSGSAKADVLLHEVSNQACNVPRCDTCPLLMNFNEDIVVNGTNIVLCKGLNCKSKNIIYMAQCQICLQSYFGQTLSEAHIRINGHREKFKIDEKLSYSKSALSQHCYDEHSDRFSLTRFKFCFVKGCRAVDLDREETRFSTKFRTDIFGLNRIKVIR